MTPKTQKVQEFARNLLGMKVDTPEGILGGDGGVGERGVARRRGSVRMGRSDNKRVSNRRLLAELGVVVRLSLAEGYIQISRICYV